LGGIFAQLQQTSNNIIYTKKNRTYNTVPEMSYTTHQFDK